MKLRESGMPGEEMWRAFFDPANALAKLGLTPACVNAVDFGCGYGTFTIAAWKSARKMVPHRRAQWTHLRL